MCQTFLKCLFVYNERNINNDNLASDVSWGFCIVEVVQFDTVPTISTFILVLYIINPVMYSLAVSENVFVWIVSLYHWQHR